MGRRTRERFTCMCGRSTVLQCPKCLYGACKYHNLPCGSGDACTSCRKRGRWVEVDGQNVWENYPSKGVPDAK